MAKKISLSVNDVPVKLIYFLQNYLDGVVSGMVASLKDTGKIENLKLSIDNKGQVKINLNGADVPLKPFPTEIIRSTILGMVSPLKGVGEVNRLEIAISR
jgi:hypothetical protein